MRVRIWVVAALLLSAGWVLAQDAPKPEQLKKMYDDALAQLKAAQDRKTELAQQNEQLTAKVGGLTKELDGLRAEMVELKRRDADSAERSFYLRSQYAAWQSFLDRYPEMKAKWNVFMDSTLLNPDADAELIIDSRWPLTDETRTERRDTKTRKGEGDKGLDARG